MAGKAGDVRARGVQSRRGSVVGPSDYLHTPVLLTETVNALHPQTDGHYIDATLGGGGHAEKVLELSSPTGVLLGVDIDPAALDAARRRLAKYGNRLMTAEAPFDQVEKVARMTGSINVDGIVFDLGVSSFQLGSAERGFSFSAEGPLDMRLGPSVHHTARDLVNDLTADELQRIFSDYAQERYARRIAIRIVQERRRRPIDTTIQLAAIVSAATAPASRRSRIHPATRVFQALRIAVNDELSRLAAALPQAVDLLRSGGRLAVISFHSMEDRIVKRFIRQEAKGCTCPPELPACVCKQTRRLRPVVSRPITATATEISVNPRSRSARLRIAERIGD